MTMGLDMYDLEEMSILARMKRTLIRKHGWEAEGFQGMNFMGIEAEFLDAEPDFRPKGN
jgi:hypothetical protein